MKFLVAVYDKNGNQVGKATVRAGSAVTEIAIPDDAEPPFWLGVAPVERTLGDLSQVAFLPLPLSSLIEVRG